MITPFLCVPIYHSHGVKYESLTTNFGILALLLPVVTPVMQTRKLTHLTEELRSLAKKKMKRSKRYPWNKGLKLGPQDPFRPADVTRIRSLLAKRDVGGLRDLALFSTAIDTMLRPTDLLGLTVKDVRKRNREMRDTIELAAKGERGRVRCTLSKTTMRVLEKWIGHSAKKPSDYLFTGRVGGGLTALSARQLSRLVKGWVDGIRLDVHSYGIISLRRTRARKDKSVH